MGTLNNLTGRQFGKLTVKYRNGTKDNRATWFCECGCGGTITVIGSRLTSGHTKSCGCLHREVFRKNDGVARANQVFASIKWSAMRRNLEITITVLDFYNLSQQRCFYCNRMPNNTSKSKYSTGDYVYNGLDRVDNTKGYTLDNVVPCCYLCNKAKGTLSQSEFLAWVRDISAHQYGK